MVFFVRVKNGQTRKLADLARDGSYELPALIDGPYGCPEDIRPFTTCIFIAGESLRGMEDVLSQDESTLMMFVLCRRIWDHVRAFANAPAVKVSPASDAPFFEKRW